MVKIIEADYYYARTEAIGGINVKTLEDLKKIADAFKEPFIFVVPTSLLVLEKTKKEYAFFHHNVCYYFKEQGELEQTPDNPRMS